MKSIHCSLFLSGLERNSKAVLRELNLRSKLYKSCDLSEFY